MHAPKFTAQRHYPEDTGSIPGQGIISLLPTGKFLESTQLYPLQMRRHFLAASFGGDVKPSVPGFWFTLALGYSRTSLAICMCGNLQKKLPSWTLFGNLQCTSQFPRIYIVNKPFSNLEIIVHLQVVS